MGLYYEWISKVGICVYYNYAHPVALCHPRVQLHFPSLACTHIFLPLQLPDYLRESECVSRG